MTKPTGRPKGAPRKYETADEKPFTVSVRVPRPWVEPLKRYAAQHRQSMSELLLDGLRWRLSEGDPRGHGVVLPPVPPQPDRPYYENTEEGNMLVREVRELRTLLTEAVASGALAAPPPHSRNTGIQESAVVAVEPRAPLPAPVPPALPPVVEPEAPALTRAQLQRRGIAPEQLKAIADERTRCLGLSIKAFAQWLYDKDIYRATSKEGQEVVCSTSALHGWLAKAEKEGLL